MGAVLRTGILTIIERSDSWQSKREISVKVIVKHARNHDPNTSIDFRDASVATVLNNGHESKRHVKLISVYSG